jgi:hypothetical protein
MVRIFTSGNYAQKQADKEKPIIINVYSFYLPYHTDWGIWRKTVDSYENFFPPFI